MRSRREPDVRERDETGAVIVEFALVVPLLLMLLLGVVTVGITYSHANGLTNAVREGSRFGATADASSSVSSAWADDVISQVRATQFDDPSKVTTVCVQLWKIGTGAVAGTGKCATSAGGPSLTLPGSAAASPPVPSSPTGSCVVRVIAARKFKINIGLTSWDKVFISSSIARYERRDKVPSCL